MLAGLTKKAGPMLKSSPIIIWTVWAAVLVLFISAAPARDLGQWEGADPLTRQWFNGLMRPDEPNLRCCGLADAYWADSYEVKGDQYVAVITEEHVIFVRTMWSVTSSVGVNAALGSMGFPRALATITLGLVGLS